MNKATTLKGPNRPRPLLLAACLALSRLPAAAQTGQPQGPVYSVVDSGADYGAWQATVSVANGLTGQASEQVTGYIELGDGLNYWTNGEWAPSQDLIEMTPAGAVAVHGQMTAAFSGDITGAGAITLTTASGQVFQSHPIGLFYFDAVSGKVAQIGSVQATEGMLYTPNVIVFTNVLWGLKADLMLVWGKRGFEQNLVMKEAPPTPESFGLSRATCRLQFWSAMDACPQPLEQRPAVLPSGLVDHILIFPDCWFPVGSAFASADTPLPPPGQAAPIRLVGVSETNAVATAKSLVSIAGQQVLIEEINYTDVLPAFSGLSHAARSPTSARAVQLAAWGQLLPAPRSREPRGRPIRFASGPYTARGVVLDYTQLSGTTNAYTFLSGTTYCISNSFTVGPSTATFQASTCLKFATNAYLVLYGPLVFPCTNCGCSIPAPSSMAIFTSVDDNAYGARINGGTANPNYAACEAIALYWNPPTTVQQALVRWAQLGILFQANPGTNCEVCESIFQDCNVGINIYTPNDVMYLSLDSYCNVVTPVLTNSATVYGSMANDCGVVSVAMVNDPTQDSGDTNTTHDVNKNTESECTFILADNSQTIVAAFSDTHLDEYGHGQDATNLHDIVSPRATWWARSTNGGTSFTNTTPLPPNPPTNTWTGDAPNPVMAYDTSYPTGPNGTIYLLANCSRESVSWMGFRLWTSTDKGLTFSLANTNVPGGNWGISNVDRPMIKVNLSTHDIYVAGQSTPPTGRGTFAAHSANGGASWDMCQPFDADAQFTDIAITPGGTVYVTWVASTLTNGAYANRVRYAWLLPGSNIWSGPANFGITLNCSLPLGERKALRFNGDTSSDWFQTLPFPRTAIANGHLYLVYSDLPSTNSTSDQGDIFLAEAAMTNSDGSLTLTEVRTVNNDRTQTDQWDPAIAVKPGATELFIGYYTRQNDPTNNSLIMAYGAKGDVANGLTNATFDCFPISPTQFPPLFAGATASTNLLFDPTSPVGPLCLNTNATVDCFATFSTNGAGKGVWVCMCNTNDLALSPLAGQPNWFQDDNTWAAADSNYFYYAWCDRSRVWTNLLKGQAQSYTNRPDADVKIARVRQ